MKKFKIIYLNSAVGLTCNALLDIPLILLFSKVGIPPYIATVVATCIGYAISISIVLLYLKKDMNFNYKATLKTLKMLILPIILVFIPVFISKYFITFEYTRLNSIISIMIHGLVGVIIYLFVTYKNGALRDVMGNDFVDKVMYKLHLKKREKNEEA